MDWFFISSPATCKAVKRPLSSSPVSCDMASRPLLLACCENMVPKNWLMASTSFFMSSTIVCFMESRSCFSSEVRSSSPMAFFHSLYHFCICGLKFSTYMALIKALRMYSLMSSEISSAVASISYKEFRIPSENDSHSCSASLRAFSASWAASSARLMAPVSRVGKSLLAASTMSTPAF